MTGTPRLPDFILIGAMKCGTTTLYRWLEQQPEVHLTSTKEPHFFSRDANWARGPEWYQSLFAEVPPGLLTGEASASYTSHNASLRASGRMADTVPDARLVYLVRDRVARLRSHYRHEIQRGRERRPLLEALEDPDCPYVVDGLYAECLAPYVDRFPADQLVVVRFEDLIAGDASGWDDVVRHLRLPSRPAPGTAYNVTAAKPQFRGAMRRLWEAGLVDRLSRVRLPRAVRKLARRALTREGPSYQLQLAQADVTIPDAIVARFEADAERFAALLRP